MSRKIVLRQVYIETGPPGVAGKIGYSTGNWIYVGPRLKDGETEVTASTSFEQAFYRWQCSVRPLNQKEKVQHGKSRGASPRADGLDAFRT